MTRLTFLLTAAAVVLASCGRAAPVQKPPQTVEVGVVVLKSGPVELTSELPGRAAPFQTSDVRPQVGGVVTSRPFREGGDVTEGEVLYTIDPAPYAAAYAQAKALLESAEASLAAAKVKADRYGGLVAVHGVAKQEYDDALAAYRQGQAAVAQETAALAAAKINLGWTKVRAAISGRIGPSSVTEGALVVPGQTAALATIQRLDPIYVNITEPAVEVLRLKKAVAAGALRDAGAGVPVRVRLEDGSDYPLEGRLQFTDVTVNEASDSVTLKAVFPNPNKVLLPGMFLEARVPEGTEPEGLLAPEQGVARDERGLPTALVVGKGGRVEFRSVTTGPEVGNQWLITGGLRPGDHLIVEGSQRVKPGDRVVERPVALTLMR